MNDPAEAGRQPPRGTLWGRRLGVLLVGLLLTPVLDRALGLLGLPDEEPWYPVGPPHHEVTFTAREYRYTVRTNDRGIRYRTIPGAKPAGTHRVVLVGDSFTEGACVDVEERWSDRIEAALSGAGRGSIELVNCGEAGTHVFDYGRSLIHLGLDYEPDAVLIGLYFDDVPNTPPDLDPSVIRSAPARRGRGMRGAVRTLWPHLATLAARVRRAAPAPPFDLVAEARRTAEERGIDDDAFRAWLDLVPEDLLAEAAERRVPPGILTYALTRPRFFEEGIAVDTEEARRKMRSVERLLDEMVEACAERGARVGVLLMPCVFQYDPASADRPTARLFAGLGHPMRAEWTRETTGLQREVAAWARRNGVPFLDLVPVFREALQDAEVPLNYEVDPHWTPAGHAVAAEAIGSWMEVAGMLPPASAGRATEAETLEEPGPGEPQRR